MEDEGVLAAARSKYGLPLRYILYLGGFDQRKNLAALLQAYARLCKSWEDGAPALVVAGRLPPVDTPLFPSPQRMAAELDITQKVIFTGWVAEEDKPALYSGALFLTFLSLYEGFGLMPLEAMACGTPVLAANTSSLPEIVGSGGVLVDPKNLDEIAAHMRALVQDAAQRQHLAQEALSQAARFAWRDTAEQTLGVYHLAAGRQERAPAATR
jgi:glycosyltransferase involved in cell wall biosynthesis